MTNVDRLDRVEFLDPGPLVHGDVELVLVRCNPADPTRDRVPSYDFEIRVPTRHGEVAGSITLRVGNTHSLIMYSGHIGYGVEEAFRGRRYAARSVRLLLPLARAHGLRTIWITCNPDNVASRRTCELAGAELFEIVSLPPDNEQFVEKGERAKARYRIHLTGSK